MTINSIGEYRFPSRSRQELYGDDQLVSVLWEDNRWFCSAVMQRAPKAMTFGDFWDQMIAPWAAADPDLDPAKGWADFAWTLGGKPFTPEAERSLADLGVGHKDVLGMSGAAA